MGKKEHNCHLDQVKQRQHFCCPGLCHGLLCEQHQRHHASATTAGCLQKEEREAVLCSYHLRISHYWQVVCNGVLEQNNCWR